MGKMVFFALLLCLAICSAGCSADRDAANRSGMESGQGASGTIWQQGIGKEDSMEKEQGTETSYTVNTKIVQEGQLLKMEISSELVPYCSKCGKPMTVNLRSDSTFVEDKGWEAAHNRYEDFIRRHKNLHILFLELGVGENTPIIIKYPFWRMTAENSKAVYVCINYGAALCPQEIEKQSICPDADIGKVMKEIM